MAGSVSVGNTIFALELEDDDGGRGPLRELCRHEH